VPHPNPIRAAAVVSLAAGALLLSGALPAFATPGLTASGTGTVISAMAPLQNGANMPQGVAVAGGNESHSTPASAAVNGEESGRSTYQSPAWPFVGHSKTAGLDPPVNARDRSGSPMATTSRALAMFAIVTAALLTSLALLLAAAPPGLARRPVE